MREIESLKFPIGGTGVSFFDEQFGDIGLVRYPIIYSDEERGLPRLEWKKFGENPLLLSDIYLYGGDELRMRSLALGREVVKRLEHQIDLYIPDPIFVFTDDLYRIVKDNQGVVPDEVKIMYDPIILSMLKNGAVGVRRAFRVPNNESGRYPSGPTLNKLDSGEKIWQAVQTVFGFARDNHDINLPSDDKGEFASICYKWIDPLELKEKKIDLDDQVPAGGQASVLYTEDDGTVVVKVESVLGDNVMVNLDGVKPEVDVHYVRCKPGGEVTVWEVEAPVKTNLLLQRLERPDFDKVELLVDGGGKDSSLWSVPLARVGLRQALDTRDIQRAAAMVTELYRMTGETYRVEFSLGEVGARKHAIVFNEIINQKPAFEVGELGKEEVVEEGDLMAVIDGEEDVKFLEEVLIPQWLDEGIEIERICMLGPTLMKGGSTLSNESTKLLSRVRACQVPLRVFYSGRANEHKLRQFIQGSNDIHRAYPVEMGGTLECEIGDHIQIVRCGGSYYVKYVDEIVKSDKSVSKTRSPYLYTLEELIMTGVKDERVVGGKMLPLLEARKMGELLPEMYLISPKLLEHIVTVFMKKSKHNIPNVLELIHQCQDEEELVRYFEVVRDVLRKALTEGMTSLWNRASESLKGRYTNGNGERKLIFRSDLTGEDNVKHSFAGKLLSVPNVPLINWKMDKAYIEVLSSYFSEGMAHEIWSLPPKDREEMLRNFSAPVLLMEMIDCENGASGVAFGKDLSGKRDERDILVISADTGSGGVVDGSLSDVSKTHVTIRYNRISRRFESVRVWRKGVGSGDENELETEYSHDQFLKLSRKSPDVSREQVVLYPDEAREIVMLLERAARRKQHPQDIEFAIGSGKNGWGVYLVQERSL